MQARSSRLWLSALCAALFLAPSSHAAILRVNRDAPGPAHDGASWATSFATVTAALNAASAGDEVWVAAGTYVEKLTLKSGIALYGGFAGTETEHAQRDFRANVTTLDANHTGSVVTIPAAVTEEAILDGFTIRHGVASDTGGGGIRCSGMAAIRNNVITSNTAYGPCTDGVCINLQGGGILSSGGRVTITGNAILDNAANSGGGIAAEGDVTIRNNLIAGNTAYYQRLTGLGGGILVGSGCQILNNTVTGNGSDVGSGIYGVQGVTGVTVVNNVLFNNANPYNPEKEDMRLVSGAVVHHNILTPGQVVAPPPGNLEMDPLFIDSYNGNFHLRPDSPCIDAGDDTFVPTGDTDMDGNPRVRSAHVDIGAYEAAVAPVFTVWRVKSDAPGPTHDGKTWDTAFRSVQEAMDAANPRDEVWIVAGTYVERITIAKSLSVFGGFNGTETAREERDPAAQMTILDGGAAGTVVTLTANGAGTTLDAFTIRNGKSKGGGGVDCAASSVTLSHNIISGNLSTGQLGAGGIRVLAHGVRILDNVIADNVLEYGGTDSCHGAGIRAEGSDGEVARNRITNNRVTGWSASGGGLHYAGAKVRIHGNVVSGNRAEGNRLQSGSDGQSQAEGAGMSVVADTLQISNNTITGNTAFARSYYCSGTYCGPGGAAIGGGLSIGGYTGIGPTQFEVTNNLIANNRADGDSISDGGGLFAPSETILIAGNTFVGNTLSAAPREALGAAVYTNFTWSHSTVNFSNNIVAFNDSATGPAIWMYTSDIFRHNDVFGNVPANYADKPSNPTGTDGNLSADPLFVDRAGGDYRLQAGSPAINSGDSALVASGATDLDGRPRIIGPVVDMGAYEAPIFATMTDAVLALKGAGGLSALIPADAYRLNVSANASPGVDVHDAVRLARKATGLE